MSKKIIIFLIVFLSPYTFSDTLILQNGSKLQNLVITAEYFDSIKYYFASDNSRSKQSMKTGRIAKIIRSKVPYGFATAEKLFEKRNYKAAIREYKKTVSDWTHQHRLFKIGLCYYYINESSKSIQKLQKLLERFPETYHKASAYFFIAKNYIQKRIWSRSFRNMRKARSLYIQIRNTPKILNTTYWLGMITEKGRKYSKAARYYRQVVSRGQKYPEIQTQAKANLAICLLYSRGRGNSREARELFLEMIKNTPVSDKETFAKAYYGLGSYYYMKDRKKKALLCYLRVVMLYPVIREYTIKAYKGAENCYKDLGGNDNKKRARQLMKQRESISGN